MSDPVLPGFSPGWLQQREPFDAAARRRATALVDWLAAGPDGHRPWAVLDLACGTGANLRALAPRLGPGQRWQVVDHDPVLLAALPEALAAWAAAEGHRLHRDPGDPVERPLRLEGYGFSATVVRRRLDLVVGLDALDWPAHGLVTASALLDLVSAAWLQDLLGRALQARAALLFALNVDGRLAWDPPDPDDAFAHGLFMAHQRGDKGFGPALGVEAAAWARQRLAEAGWRVQQAATDWHIDGMADPRMLLQMLDGGAAAAAEQSPADAPRIHAWAQRRRAAAAASRLVVGHLDLAARPDAPG